MKLSSLTRTKDAAHFKGKCGCGSMVWTWNINKGYLYLVCASCRQVCRIKLSDPDKSAIDSVEELPSVDEDDEDIQTESPSDSYSIGA